MARPRDPKKRRITSSVAGGYAEVIGGMWYTRIGGVRQSTMLKDTPANEARVRSILEERSLDHAMRKLGRGSLAAAPAQLATVFDLRDEFLQVRGPQLVLGARRYLEHAMSEYFPLNVELAYEGLYRHLVTAIGASRTAVSTRRKRLQMLRRLFRFAVERQYIDRNPLDTIGIPKAPRKEENQIYTHAEVDAIVQDLVLRKGMLEYALLFRLLVATAMRVGEALKLRWSDVDEHSIRINGKGERRRNFPLDSFPEVRGILVELEQFRERNRGKLFRWPHATQPQWHLKQAKQRRGIAVDDRRALHTFRATCEHWWSVERGLPVETICKLAGHSIAVHVRDYHATPTAEELAAEIARGSGTRTREVLIKDSARSQPNTPTFHADSGASVDMQDTADSAKAARKGRKRAVIAETR